MTKMKSQSNRYSKRYVISSISFYIAMVIVLHLSACIPYTKHWNLTGLPDKYQPELHEQAQLNEVRSAMQFRNIDQVNRYVNFEHTWVPNWQIGNRWLSFDQFQFLGHGSCKDFVTAKYVLIRDNHLATSERPLVVRTSWGELHEVLVVDNKYVLDSIVQEIMMLNDPRLNKYTPLYWMH